MERFTFYIEGLNREAQVDTEDGQKDAYAMVWNDLTNDEQDAVISIDCLDQVEISKATGASHG